MIIRSFLFALFAFTCASAVAQDLKFANLTWGTNSHEVRSKLVQQGFTKVSTDKDGDVRFEGKLLGYEMYGFGLFAEGGLAKVTVVLLVPDNKARDKYRELKQTLTEKYGSPAVTIENFQRPYYEGDGYEEQAIRLGKARLATLWEGDNKSGLVLEITEKLNLRFSYESPAWGVEAEKRRRQQTKLF
jgi:hypothetical protein